jgi:MFS transporter, AAHS family, 4-hydroxybenzoate transporter
MRIDVAEVIERSSISLLQLRVAILCSLVAMLDGFDIQTMAIVMPTVAAKWGLVVQDYRWALSASSFGMLVGALLGGPLGDRFGRRNSILFAFAFMGVMSLMTATSQSLRELIQWRFLTGIGLGGCLPNIIALTVEYFSEKRRGLVVTLMFCGVPLGGGIGSFIAADIVAKHDWPAMFVLGGVLPLAICVLLFAALPESIRFLVTRKADFNKVAALLKGIDRKRAYIDTDNFVVPQSPHQGVSVSQLFVGGRTPMTLLLWLVFFGTLFTFYFLLNMLPVILRQAGWTPKDVSVASSLLQISGVVGGILLAWLSDRFSAEKVLLPTYVIGVVAIGLTGYLISSTDSMKLAIALVGSIVLGAQFCINALAASVYPTEARSTGVGWALGIGRVGAIAAPLIGGTMLASLSVQSVFMALAIPAAMCAIAVFVLGLKRNKMSG